MSRYLGLDASTQSLTAIVVDTETQTMVLDLTVNFGTDLPQYNCPQGFLPDPDPLVKHSDPLLWAAALDLVLARAKEQGFDWSTIDGISGSGQQHGSIYLNSDYHSAGNWRTDASLADQVEPCLSRATAPIWMDSSTERECREIAAAAGGDAAVTSITGSRAIERFTGPQIRRFYKLDPNGYLDTARIHLVSSFMAWLLCGTDTPIDYGDGAGMNLFDLAKGDWSPTMLRATAPGLADKLPAIVPATDQVGTLHAYFAEKYGFRPNVPVIAFSGDNPNSLVGMGASTPGTAVISLGTSDTCFAAMSQPKTDPNGYGHVFGNPAGGFMCLIAFKNGSLAREAIKDQHNFTWDEFADAILNQTQPGNGGKTMLFFSVPEITPKILHPVVEPVGGELTPAEAARAIVEAQAINIKLNSAWIGEQPSRILVTGGASQNPAIRQVLADVFQATITPLAVSNSAGLGAALRAACGVGGHAWEELYTTFCEFDVSQEATPDPATRDIYEALTHTFAKAVEPHVS